MYFSSVLNYAVMASVSVVALAASAPAFAQDAGASSTGEIVVTARKREETALQVPVSVTALSGA